MREITNDSVEEMLAKQVPQDAPRAEAPTQEATQVQEAPAPAKSEAAQYLGTNLTHKIGGYGDVDKDADKELVREKKLSKVGEQIGDNAEIRDGWMEVDRQLLGARDVFYPADWRFRIRPATVEAIRNWSTIDDESVNSVDDVFNEILKSCLSIVTPNGPLPWGNIRSWDRFFFVLLIREYTFINGEAKVEYEEECPNCENPVKFTMTSTALDFDMPDPDVMKYYSQEDQEWVIDPAEFDINEDPVHLNLPTLDKTANIKAWVIQRYQENKKVDPVFLKFLPWMANKIAKDMTIANRQIREYEVRFKSWDTEMFQFMDSVIKNIMVTPSTKLITTCPVCGEEVTSEMRFPNGVSALFAVQSGHKKFGKK